jgi:RNA polymerase sigma factor (sigma-70 family)
MGFWFRRSGGRDSELIARSLGDGRAFASIFDRYYDEIWRYLCRRAGPTAADELASETFVRAFAGRAAYDRAQANARAWLYGIATNLLRERYRSERRYLRALGRAFEAASAADGTDEVDARVDASALAPQLGAALAGLSADDRDALLLLALAELSYEEIAVSTGVPVGTVRSRLHRARRRCKQALASDPAAVNESINDGATP